jgi:hypothetical protein
MCATTSHPNEYGEGRSAPQPPSCSSSRIKLDRENGLSAEIDLCADRAGLIKRKDIIDHTLDHMKRHIMHPSPESQIRGFKDLFVYLNTTPGVEALRRPVTTYFSGTLPYVHI